MRTIILATAACAVCLRVSAQVEVYETGTWLNLRVAAQKTNGQITAAGTGDWCAWNWNENWQPSYNNSPWNGWGSGDTARGTPVSMENVSDGTVVSIWSQKNGGAVFGMVHDADNSYGANARWDNLPGPASSLRLFKDSRTNFWITEAGLNICQSPSNQRGYRQSPALVHAITLGELWPGGNATNRLPVSMAEDARGRIWFWSNCLLGDDSRGAVRGVLTCENGVVTNRPALEGVTDGRISVIAPLNVTNLWLAVRDAGIFSVNLDTLAGARVAEPETNAFRVVQQIFSVGEDRYVISGSPSEYNTNGLRSALWRWRGGRWTKLVDGLDAGGSPEELADRHRCVTKEGLWLGAFGLGGWFVPINDGPAQVINWQKNSPFDTIHRWFQFKDGRMLGLQFGRGGLVADAAWLAEKPALPAAATVIRTSRPLLQTEDGRVFGFLRGKEKVFCEWEGKDWHEYPLPEKFQPGGEYEVMLDSLNRIWWVYLSYRSPDSTPSFIFDPARKRFVTYASYGSALQAQLPRPAGLRIGTNEYFAPKFSTDGRICFEDRFSKLYYFNGRTWREWEKSKISNPQPWYQAFVNPFFASDGSLDVTLNKTIWGFTEMTGWRTNATARLAAAGEIATGKNSYPAAPPAISSVDSLVTDRFGTYWLTSGGQLFRTSFGLTRSCFAANEPQPFADGRKLAEVLRDNFGNAFFRTSVQGRDEYVLLPAHEPLPHTTAKLLENTDDGVTLQLAANIPSPRFSWRVDDAPWSETSTNQTLRLEQLAAGKHRVQIVALDAQLQTDPAPADVLFESHSNPAQQIQKWIAQLGDKDFARREAAVKNLSRHPETALPVLRQARERESDSDRRWWLNAAIQQCE